MKLNFLNRKKIHPDINYLELTPYPLYEHFVKDDGKVMVLMPKFKNKFMASFVPRNKSQFVNVHLDELGSEVWLELGSEKKVEQIIEILTLRLGERIHPADERITKFLTNLYQNKFIGFRELELNE